MTENPYSPPTPTEPPVLLPREAKPGEVVLQFLYGEEYLVQALKRFNSQKPKSLLVKRVLICLFMFLVAAISYNLVIGSIMVCLGLLLLLLPYWVNHLLLRNVSKTPHFNQTATLVISEAGVYAEQPLQDTHFRWPVFTECIRMKDGFLLMQGANQFHWLSDSTVQRPEDIELLFDLLRRHVVKFREVA